MRHLLIILSFLLLSSFLTSCEKKEGTLYFSETSSGYEWKEIGDKDTQIQYRGFVDDGSPDGLGVMTFPNGDKYVGELKDSYPNGQGTYTWTNGTKFVGDWKDGEQWNGTETWSDGGKYVGEYKDGKKHGQGTFTFGKGEWEGDKYVGEWKNGEKDGHGTYTYSDGRKWVGEFRKNKDWNTTLYDKNGNIIGKWLNGVEQK